MKIKTMCALLAIGAVGFGINIMAISTANVSVAQASTRTFADFEALPPIHMMAGSGATTAPEGLSPASVKKAYLLPATGGSGTIAIVSVYEHPDLEKDLGVFDKQFALASCTIANKCLTIYDMKTATKVAKGSTGAKGPTNAGWDLESALDSEWAHAIAPKSKILIVEAVSASGANLMKAVDYARAQAGVVSVSMSWGGDEFSDEATLDSHFSGSVAGTKSTTGVVFFASSGDDGAGASWPAVAHDVIAVGGTSLTMSGVSSVSTSATKAKFVSEKAWSGSGGGVSAYETEPAYQKSYSIPRANGMRAIPDVSYSADPQHGFSVYHNGWYVIGGTSAGAPQWAALATLGMGLKHPISLTQLYKDKASSVSSVYFRDITSGTNGTCGYYCTARNHYDYVTGLGSPITDMF